MLIVRPHMRLARRRIRQVIIGILAVLSLSVSSVAACMCSHHEKAPTPERSCHGPAHHEQDSPDAGAPSFEQTCECIRPSGESPVKAETFKLKKHLVQSAASTDATPTSFIVKPIPPVSGADVPLYDRLACYQVRPRGPPLS